MTLPTVTIYISPTEYTMAFSVSDELLQDMGLKAFSLSTSAKTSLSLGVLIIVGAWRHYDTNTHPNPFQQEVWIEWLSWVILFTYQRIRGSPIRAPEGLDCPHLPSFWGSRYAVWLTAAACIGSQLLSSQSLPGPIWVRRPLHQIEVCMLKGHSSR